MRTSAVIAVVPVAVLSAACVSGGFAGVPTGPSAVNSISATPTAPAVVAQHTFVLMGEWRVLGTTAFRNLETGNTLNMGNCSGSVTVTLQEGDQFAGTLDTQGSGRSSDRFCTATGALTGELIEGSIAKARLEGNFQNWPRPAVSPACEMIGPGDGIWTGSVSDDAIRLEMRDRLRCAANVDGGINGVPMANFERTVSLTLQRR